MSLNLRRCNLNQPATEGYTTREDQTLIKLSKNRFSGFVFSVKFQDKFSTRSPSPYPVTAMYIPGSDVRPLLRRENVAAGASVEQ